ncbi:MAG: hypothetical protein HFJ26_04560 [Clostridia bacterium]|jgi:hypothetical protein|nr:hypothetical protein [Clostridia bacterium]
MNSSDQITQMLTIVLVVMVFVLIILAVAFLYFWIKSKKQKEQQEENDEMKSDARKIAREYTKQSIFKFMEFDTVEDNMIVQKKGMRYIMVVECQGINYDLMSEGEKVGVEEGFLQFLNTLRHPVQIYVQTRTVNLNDSLEGYRRKVEEVGFELEKKKNAYLKKLQSGTATREELNKDFFEVTKQTNLYEYGKDIIANTERMSLNKNVLSKKYYVIIPYYVEDLGSNNSFDKEEIRSIAFQELYTRAQSVIRTLAGCSVGGKILNSEQLVDLLYVAYNRDEAEVFSVDRATRAGYDELYTTAPDVLDKTMKALDDEIERKAMALANEKVIQARSPKQQQLDQKRARLEELVRQRAQMIIKQNAAYLGRQTADSATRLIEEEKNKEEGGTEDVEEKPKRGRRKKTAVNE